MTSHPINDPEHWRKRAEQMRALAQGIKDAQSKITIRRIANEYDKLAERAERLARGSSPASSSAPPRVQ